jgi:hypothetical protein
MGVFRRKLDLIIEVVRLVVESRSMDVLSPPIIDIPKPKPMPDRCRVQDDVISGKADIG